MIVTSLIIKQHIFGVDLRDGARLFRTQRRWFLRPQDLLVYKWIWWIWKISKYIPINLL